MKTNSCAGLVRFTPVLLLFYQSLFAQCFYPPMQQPLNQTVCNGQPTAAIGFVSGVAGSAFSWTNDHNNIGLAASGSGNIASFVAINAGSSPDTAHITVTPYVVSNGTGLAYIANYNSGTVSVINPLTQQQITSIPVGVNPYGVAVSNDGTKVYVANRGSGTVSVINTSNHSVSASIQAGNQPQGVAITRSGNKVYVSNEGSNTLTVLDAMADTVLTQIPTGNMPNGITIHPNGIRVYVANLAANSVTVIDGNADTVVTTVDVGMAPQSLCMHPNGTYVYVVNGGSNEVSIIQASNNTVTGNIPVQQNPKGIAIEPGGRWLYVSNYASGSVTVIDALQRTVIKHLAVGINPHGIAASSDGKLVVVANRGSGTVSVIQIIDQTVAGSIPVGVSPASPGNFMAKSDTCIGSITTCSIVVHPVNTSVPAVQIATNNPQVKPGATVLFTTNTTHAGVSPVFAFYINNQLKQSGTQSSFLTNQLQDGDKVSCTMTSSIPCITTAQATSDSITVSTQVAADYVFFPTDADGLYTNQANWLQGNYPGALVAENKTISFRKNGKYQHAVIDTSIVILGEWYVEDSIELETKQGTLVVFGQQGSFPPAFGRVLSCSFSSSLTVNGNLTVYGARASFGKQVTVNGNTNFQPGDPQDQFVSSLYFDSLLQVNGHLGAQVASINAKLVQVSAPGQFTMSHGFDFNQNQLYTKRLVNDGYMFLDEGTLHVSKLENNGNFTSDFLDIDSILVNSGSFTIHCKTPVGATAVSQYGLLSNTGTMSFHSDGGLRCQFSGQVVNDGTFSLSTNYDPALADMAIFSGVFFNKKSFSTQFGTARFTGSAINAGNMNVFGRIILDGGSFNNTGHCTWNVTSTTLANELNGSFLNTGIIDNTGLLEVSHSFVNAGVLNVIPY